MALPNDITLNPQNSGGANVATAFAFVTEKDQKSIRRVTATALTAPQTLTIQHQSRVQGGLKVNSHQIREDLTKIDTLKGQVTMNAWLVINLPEGQTAIGVQDVKDVIGHIAELCKVSGYVEKILAGES